MITEEEAAKDLSIYHNNTLILWGCGLWGEHFLTLADKLDLEIFACCDNDEAKWGTEFHGIPVISPDELEQLNQQKQKNPEEKQIVVQLAVAEKHQNAVAQQIKSLSISLLVDVVRRRDYFYPAVFTSFFARYPQPDKEESIRQTYQAGRAYCNNGLHLPDPRTYDHLVICQQGKTGDITIAQTYSRYANIALAHEHDPSTFHKEDIGTKGVKVVAAIRDPIATDLSQLFQWLASGEILLYDNLFSVDPIYFHQFLTTENPQPIFDNLCQNRFTLGEGLEKSHGYTRFFQKFSDHILDIAAHPFDKEKGYAIMKEGKIEVFMYQLEKLNDLVPELSDWMGLKFDKLENDNVAADKWIASSYERAKKEITFSQEYFDICYNDPYVKHCYSPEDIEKFKEKWRSHIR